MNLIQKLEQEEMQRMKKSIPEFSPGDTVIVNVNVVEGDRKRVQAYEGVCIARQGQGVDESFTVRKISFGEGVERGGFALLDAIPMSVFAHGRKNRVVDPPRQRRFRLCHHSLPMRERRAWRRRK